MENNLFELRFHSRDIGETTVRAFFIELLTTLWKERECFSGKRPFGNSDWDCDLIACLIKNGVLSGTFDVDGNPDDYDSDAFEEFVLEHIIKKL